MEQKKKLIDKWKNYGYDSKTLQKFKKEIEFRNLKAIRAFCFTYTILNVFFLVLEGFLGDSLIALGYICISLCIIVFFSRFFHNIILSKKELKYTSFYVTGFSTLTYLCTIYWSSYVQAEEFGVFAVCMLFFIPFVVNEKPMRAMIQMIFVVVIFSIVSFWMKSPFHAISDTIHAIIAAIAGYMVSYTKNRQVLEELIATDKLEKANEELNYLNTVDLLTGIYNRKKIFSILDEFVLRSKEEDKVLACAILDLDNFKIINDTFGHPKGDMILKEAGMIIGQIIEKVPMVEAGRIGGEEFMIVAYDMKNNEFGKICTEINQKIHTLTITSEITKELFYASASSGFCVLDGKNIEHIYNYADKALYCAKNNGKNCTWYYSFEEKEYYEYKISKQKQY